MPLETVRVPGPLEPVFERAEAIVGDFFRRRKDDPRTGTIEIFDARYVLIRGAALSVEFFQLVRNLFGAGAEADADAFAASLLYDLAHAVGKSDARNFHQKMGLEDPVAKLSAGPVHFSHSGWAFVDIHAQSNPTPDDNFVLLYDHPYAFEAHAWLAAEQTAPYPICVMNAGYSSGWCEESFDIDLEAVEVACRAHGDPCCRFIMAPPHRITEHIDRYLGDHPEFDSRSARRQRPDFFSRNHARRTQDGSSPADTLAQKLLLGYANKLEDTQLVLQDQVRRLEIEIEEHARAESELLISEARLRQVHKMEALGTLAGGIAHDFNNILGAIVGYGELARDDLPDAGETREYLDEVLKAARRAQSLVKQILAFSRKSDPALVAMDLAPVVRDAVRLLRASLPTTIEIHESIPEGAGTVMADADQIHQLVLNLGTNAAQAIPDRKGTLTITLASGDRMPESVHRLGAMAGGPCVRLRVRDTGQGMTTGVVARIFDPFFTTKTVGEGTGLGLAAVHGIVTSHGGVIKVDSAPGEGTEFEIFLPTTGAAPITAHDPALPRATGKEHVLFVDDERQITRLGAEMLARLGYRVTTCSRSREALRIFAESPEVFDVIVTDHTMPDLTGIDLAREARAIDPTLPIVLTTGFHEGGTAAATDTTGLDSVLLKPYTAGELGRAIREAIERSAPPGAAT